jgi:hypothetical protein
MKYDDSLLILFLNYDFDHEENTYPLFLPDCPGERGFCPTQAGSSCDGSGETGSHG